MQITEMNWLQPLGARPKSSTLGGPEAKNTIRMALLQFPKTADN